MRESLAAIVHYRAAFACLAAVVTLVALAGMTRLGFDDDFRSLFKTDSREYADYEQLLADFGEPHFNPPTMLAAGRPRAGHASSNPLDDPPRLARAVSLPVTGPDKSRPTPRALLIQASCFMGWAETRFSRVAHRPCMQKAVMPRHDGLSVAPSAATRDERESHHEVTPRRPGAMRAPPTP